MHFGTREEETPTLNNWKHQYGHGKTLNNWRNTAGESLHNQNITYATRYMNDDGLSTVDRILNSGPQSVLQAEGLLISTDADIAELSDHRPIWAHYTVSGDRDSQGKVRKGKKAKRLQLLRTELTLKNKAEVQRYQDIISKKFLTVNLENMDPAEIINHLSILSYDAI